MTRKSVLLGLALGALTSIPVLVLSYLGHWLLTLPFVPFNLFDWQARVLPGRVITFGIDTIVNLILALNLGSLSQTAKLAEQILALTQFVLTGAVFGAVLGGLRGRARAACGAGDWPAA